jgi:hypothetical protein
MSYGGVPLSLWDYVPCGVASSIGCYEWPSCANPPLIESFSFLIHNSSCPSLQVRNIYLVIKSSTSANSTSVNVVNVCLNNILILLVLLLVSVSSSVLIISLIAINSLSFSGFRTWFGSS